MNQVHLKAAFLIFFIIGASSPVLASAMVGSPVVYKEKTKRGFEQLVKQWMKNPEDRRLYLKVSAAVKSSEENRDYLISRMQVVDISTYLFQSILAIISEEGSSVSQSAVLDLAQAHPEDVIFQNEILLYLAINIKNPTQETEDYARFLSVESLNSEIKRNAHILLGCIAGHLKNVEPLRAERILQETIIELQVVESIDYQQLLLQKLGNMGMNDSISVIEPFLSHRLPKIRKDAVFALRFILDVRATELAEQVAMRDSDKEVRRAALDALGFMKKGAQ